MSDPQEPPSSKAVPSQILLLCSVEISAVIIGFTFAPVRREQLATGCLKGKATYTTIPSVQLVSGPNHWSKTHPLIHRTAEL